MSNLEQRVLWNASPPRVRLEHALLDVAADATSDHAAIATLADGVQSRRTTGPRLTSALTSRIRIARRAFLGEVIADITAGTCSALEHGYLERDLLATVDGRTTVRIGWGQVFERPCLTAGLISTLLRQRGWSGVFQPCPDCA